MKTILMNRLMDTRFELQCKAIAFYKKTIFLLFQATLLCNGSWVHVRSLK